MSKRLLLNIEVAEYFGFIKNLEVNILFMLSIVKQTGQTTLEMNF